MKMKLIETCADCEHYETYSAMTRVDGCYCYKANITGSIRRIPKGCPLEDCPLVYDTGRDPETRSIGGMTFIKRSTRTGQQLWVLGGNSR